jgi:hypothetical protein
MLVRAAIVPSFGEARRALPIPLPSIGRPIAFQSNPPRSRSTPPSALQWLGEDEAFRRLQHDARRLMALQTTLTEITGSLDVRAVRLDGTTLCVTVTGPSMAARLRQIEPLAIATLRQQGWAVEKLRSRSRTPEPVANPPVARPKPPAAAAAALQSLALQLEASPLRSGVLKLAQATSQSRAHGVGSVREGDSKQTSVQA